jgi:hypothetical protein
VDVRREAARLRSVVVIGVVLALSGGTAAGDAGAQGLDDRLFVSGFVSQGYLNTSENDYLVPRSVNGTAEYTEAAVTMVARPADRLRVGMQFLARNFGDTGNGTVVVDWAYGDYRYRDWLGVRGGKIKLPFGFYNEGRDVDMLRTTVFLPQSIYNEKMRDFILAYNGVGVYGNTEAGGWGEIDYHVYGGTLTVPDATRGFWHELYTEGGIDFEQEVAELVGGAAGYPATAEFRAIDDETVSFPWVYGGALTWATPLEGLRLGATAMRGQYNFRGNFRYDVLLDTGQPSGLPEFQVFTLELDETSDIDHIAVASLEYARDRWQLASEYYHERINDADGYGWYVQGGWQTTRRLALALTYGEVRADERYSTQGILPAYYSWQKDFTVSLRYDLNDHWLVKFERHFLDGVALAQRRSLAENLADPLAKSWGMYAAKVTFHF